MYTPAVGGIADFAIKYENELNKGGVIKFAKAADKSTWRQVKVAAVARKCLKPATAEWQVCNVVCVQGKRSANFGLIGVRSERRAVSVQLVFFAFTDLPIFTVANFA